MKFRVDYYNFPHENRLVSCISLIFSRINVVVVSITLSIPP